MGSGLESMNSEAEPGSYNGAAAEGFEKYKNSIHKNRRSESISRPDKNNNTNYYNAN